MSCKDVLRQFKDRYLDATGEFYIPSYGRDLKIFKELLKLIEYDKLADLIELYFEKKSDSYNPVFFKSNINQLMECWRKQNPIQPKFNNVASGRFK